MALNVYTDLDYHGNKFFNADLTQIPRESFPPDTLPGSSTILAGPGIVVTDNGDGTVTISAAPPPALKVEAFNQRFTVTDPLSQAPLTVVHNFGTTLVAVTVLEVGTPSVPVHAKVSVIDENTVEALLTGEATGLYDIFVVAGIDPGNV
jgi:hypothetical protein